MRTSDDEKKKNRLVMGADLIVNLREGSNILHLAAVARAGHSSMFAFVGEMILVLRFSSDEVAAFTSV